MKRLTLYIGHNVNGEPTYTAATIANAIEEHLSVSAYTLLSALGVWQGASEQSTACIISNLTDAKAAAIIERTKVLCAALQQCEILIESEDVNVIRIEREEETTQKGCA